MFVNFDFQYDRGVAWKPDGWLLKPFRQQITALAELRTAIDEVRLCDYYGLSSGDLTDPVMDGVDIATSFWRVAGQLAAHVPGAAAAMPVMPIPNRWFEDGLRYHSLFNKAGLNQSLCELSEWTTRWPPVTPVGSTPAGAAVAPVIPPMTIATVASNASPTIASPQQTQLAVPQPASLPAECAANASSIGNAFTVDVVTPASMPGFAPSSAPVSEQGTIKRLSSTWDIRLGDESAHVKHNVNVQRIALILSRPGQLVADAELVGDDGNKHANQSASPDHVLDLTALREIRARHAEAKAAHEVCVKNCDFRQADQLTLEIGQILVEVNKAVDLSGNQRSFQQTVAANDRKNVQASLKRAYKLLGSHGLNGIVAHLKKSIYRRGRSLVYEPGGGGPPWDVSLS